MCLVDRHAKALQKNSVDGGCQNTYKLMCSLEVTFNKKESVMKNFKELAAVGLLVLAAVVGLAMSAGAQQLTAVRGRAPATGTFYSWQFTETMRP